MATSGTIKTSAWEGNYGSRYLELTWERQSVGVVEQTSTIKWTLTGKGTYTGYVLSAPFEVVIDGEKVYESGSSRIKLYPEQVIASGTKTIKHNTDGTKTFAVNVKAAIYWSEFNVSGSGTFALDVVGMASITKAPNFNDEGNPTIEYYNPVGNNLTTLQAAISLTGANVDIAYRDISKTGKSYTFALTEAERQVLRAATQGSNSRTIRFYLRNVVEGEILFSWKEATFTVVNALPEITASVIDANAATVSLTGNNKTLIRYHSTAYATMAATALKEATLTATRIENNGKSAAATILSVPNVGGNTFTFTATDSRNNATNKTIVAQMIDYIKPSANIDTAAKMDTTGTYNLTVSGNYYNDTFGYTSAAAANTLSIKYRYKTQGGTYGAWTAATYTLDGNTYTAAASITGLDYRTTYILQCQVADKLNTITTAEININSVPVFHWSSTDFAFEVPVYFNGGVELSGNSGTWKPTLNGSYVSSYDTQEGWWLKMGNVAVIGFNVKATIKPGGSGSQLVISGCPFNAAVNAFGGGVAHNVSISAGHCFEGWCLTTAGKITGRGQPCNGTAAENLNITSAVNYPLGSSNTLITLSGTICCAIA